MTYLISLDLVAISY